MSNATTHNSPFGDQAIPELTEEQQKRADEIVKNYNADDRPTVVLPGSHGTVSGTAISEWVDDDGNPKYHDVTGAEESGDR